MINKYYLIKPITYINGVLGFWGKEPKVPKFFVE